MEHYSNFDLPNLLYLLEHRRNRPDIADDIIAIAGMKLNSESSFVRAFTEAYTRIVIYPSRSLTPLIGSDGFAKEMTRSREINRAALHEMAHQKQSGNIILIFPTGTRYREGMPETRRGLSEITSYMKKFDYFLPIAIAGNILRINTVGNMSEDYVHEDCVVFQAGKVIEAKKWRNDARSLTPRHYDAKQYVADRIMDLLKDLHVEAEKKPPISAHSTVMAPLPYVSISPVNPHPLQQILQSFCEGFKHNAGDSLFFAVLQIVIDEGRSKPKSSICRFHINLQNMRYASLV